MRLIRFAFVLAAALICGTVPALAIDANPGTSFLPIRSEAPPPAGAQALCRKLDWACARGRSGRAGPEVLALAAAVSRSANAAIPSVSDMAQYGVPERWVLPTARGGDCEDYALFKKRALIQAGIAPNRLLLATVLDRQNQGHAVLVLRTDQGDFVLDNVTDRVLPLHRTGYLFVRMQNPARPSGWVSVFAQSRAAAGS